MRKLKKIITKYYYMIPWLVVGTYILVRGNITRLEYGATWICVLILLYLRFKKDWSEI